jgi:beta-glucosidase
MKRFLISIFVCTLTLPLITAFSPAPDESETKKNQFIEELLSKMTLEEKIGQLNLINSPGDVVTGPKKGKNLTDDIKSGRLGNVLNAIGIDYIRSLQRIAVEESRLGIPLTFAFFIDFALYHISARQHRPSAYPIVASSFLRS